MTGSRHDARTLTLSTPNAELAAPPATSINVDITPTIGEKGLILWTNLGAYLPRLSPHTRGSNTRLATDWRTAIPSTTTIHCSSQLINIGVAKTPNKVVVSCTDEFQRW